MGAAHVVATVAGGAAIEFLRSTPQRGALFFRGNGDAAQASLRRGGLCCNRVS